MRQIVEALMEPSGLALRVFERAAAEACVSEVLKRHRRLSPSLSCERCGVHVEVLVKAFAPNFEAYKVCGCGSVRIDEHVTVRWFECTNANAAKPE